jgi:hypothetical protein
MYAFFVNSHWQNYLTNNPNKNANSISDTMEFLSKVGTPYLVETNQTNNYAALTQVNGTDGFFVQVTNGTAVKFDASLFSSDFTGRIRNLVIA